AAVTPFAYPEAASRWQRFRQKLAGTAALGQLDAASARTGRAMQAGGPELRVRVDGASGKRPVKRSTFYRHLRDLQVVRPQSSTSGGNAGFFEERISCATADSRDMPQTSIKSTATERGCARMA